MASSEKNPFDSDEETVQNSIEPKTENEEPDMVFEPEGEPQGMVVKPACDCASCEHWLNSVDWCTTPNLNFEGSSQSRQPKEKKYQPLLRSEQYLGKTPKILSYSPNHLTKLERQTVFKTLVHGEVIPKPVKMCTETHFSKDIQTSLQALNYKYSVPIQAFVWPAIFRKMNVFMIGSPKSGKTLAYLPAVCTFATMADDEYEELAKYKGPLVVIVCPNSKECEEVHDLIKKLYENIQVKPKISLTTYPVVNVHYCDILITIPDSLLHCLKTRMFNLKRLCHLVFEDLSTLLKNTQPSIHKILDVVDEMLEHRYSSIQVQVIATSEKWTTDVNKLVQKMYVTPLICISNYLEAALYGNIQFKVKFLMAQQKMAYLEGVLKDKYQVHKTIIICDNSEIGELSKFLTRRGIKTIALSDSSSKEDVEEYEIEWAYTPGGHHKVLLCTDFVFESLLSVNDAMWLVHYSFPSSWTRFTRRFSALSSHYKSPLTPNQEGIPYKSFLLIDETCEDKMAKILNLLKRVTKDLNANYQKYADGFRSKTESNKLKRRVDLCKTLKLFGKCSDSLCESRHLVSEQVDVTKDLPKSGRIVFKILNMKDVTEYSVQLIEHIDANGTVWKINDDDLKKPLVYGENEEKKRAADIQKDKFYAHCDHTTEGEVYTLCHVLDIKDKHIDVKFSTGLTLQTLKSKLFEVPSELKIVDVCFCNLIPPFKDEQFSGRSFFVTRNSLENKNYKKLTLTGTILLQLDSMLWLDNVIDKFSVDGSEVIRFNLTKHIISLQVVEPCQSQITSLHKLCKKCDIVLPTNVKQVVKKTVKNREVEPQYAFLDDNINEVIISSAISPDEFYVRLVKFQSLLQNLEKDIQDVMNHKILDQKIPIEIGKYYLAPDPKEEMYSRVKVLNAENDKVLCFYVDYGDEAVLEVSKLKTLPTKFLTRLPFQAIQCRLYGLTPSFDEWDDESTDLLYKYMFEPDSDIFRSIFVEMRSKDDADKIRAKVKYSVLMKDGYGDKNVLINQLMLDCGFAISIFDKLDDFEIPQPRVVEDADDSDFDECYQEEEKVNEELMDEHMKRIMDDECELEVIDADEFLETLGFQIPKEPHPYEPIEYNNIERNMIEPSHSEGVCENTENLTPEIYWSQTDETVKLKIKLIGVEQYKANVVQKKIFSFSTNLDDRIYEVKFTLHKPVEMAKHYASGQEVVVVLNKLENTEWLQLSGGKKRLRYIHYELSQREEKEVKKKFLQLDITDDESDENEEKIMIHEISDMESDFDLSAESSTDFE